MRPSLPASCLFLCLMPIVLVACGRAGAPDCARTQAIARALPKDVDPKPKMIGGFLNIALEGQPLKRCAAHFEILALGQRSRMLVWTARHCGSERFKDAKRLSVDLFVGGEYLRDLEISDDFLERRRLALAAAQAEGLHDAAQTALRDAFDVFLGAQAKREDAGCSNEELANQAAEKGLHSVCANWWDLGVYEMSLTAPVSSPAAYDKLVRARGEFIAARDAARTKLTLKGGWESRPDQWTTDILDAWRWQRLKTASNVVKWIEENCDARKADAKAPLAACEGREALVELADRYVVEGGRSIVDVAEDFGYVDQGKFRTPQDAPSLFERLKREEGDRVVRIQDLWRKWGREFLFEKKNMHLNTNVTESRSAGLAVGYVSMPLASLASSGLTLKFVTHGFEYVVAKEKVAVQFSPGDSGTIFALEGVWPLVALSGVDGEQSSGGASVTALPTRRRASQGGSGADTANGNGNRNGPRESASNDGGCQALM
jgi:hypothetical protein